MHRNRGRRLLSALAGSSPAFTPGPTLAVTRPGYGRRLLSALAGSSPAFTAAAPDEYRSRRAGYVSAHLRLNTAKARARSLSSSLDSVRGEGPSNQSETEAVRGHTLGSSVVAPHTLGSGHLHGDMPSPEGVDIDAMLKTLVVVRDVLADHAGQEQDVDLAGVSYVIDTLSGPEPDFRAAAVHWDWAWQNMPQPLRLATIEVGRLLNLVAEWWTPGWMPRDRRVDLVVLAAGIVVGDDPRRPWTPEMKVASLPLFRILTHRYPGVDLKVASLSPGSYGQKLVAQLTDAGAAEDHELTEAALKVLAAARNAQRHWDLKRDLDRQLLIRTEGGPDTATQLLAWLRRDQVLRGRAYLQDNPAREGETHAVSEWVALTFGAGAAGRVIPELAQSLTTWLTHQRPTVAITLILGGNSFTLTSGRVNAADVRRHIQKLADQIDAP